jgi:hypothetical protein
MQKSVNLDEEQATREPGKNGFICDSEVNRKGPHPGIRD